MTYLKRIQKYSGQFYSVIVGPICLAKDGKHPHDATHAILSPEHPSPKQVQEVLSKGEFALVK